MVKINYSLYTSNTNTNTNYSVISIFTLILIIMCGFKFFKILILVAC